MLSDLDIAHGFEHSNDMGTESWRIDVVTRIETGGMTRMNVRPDYPSHGSGAPVVAAVFTGPPVGGCMCRTDRLGADGGRIMNPFRRITRVSIRCRLGIHRWVLHEFVYANWYECERCHTTMGSLR